MIDLGKYFTVNRISYCSIGIIFDFPTFFPVLLLIICRELFIVILDSSRRFTFCITVS